MRDIKFVLGECTKSNVKYYFQYNNKVYFIIEKTQTQENIIDRITNVRAAYDKWRSIKDDSDEKLKRTGDDSNSSDKEKDYSYTSIVFEYESDNSVNPKSFNELVPKDKVKFTKIFPDKNEESLTKTDKKEKNYKYDKFDKFEKLERFEKIEKKRSTRKNDFDRRNKDDKNKYYKKKNNSHYDKNGSYNRRSEHKGNRQNHNA